MSTRKTDNPRAWLNDQVAAIRARKDLNDEGRTAHIGRAYLEAKKAGDAKRAIETAAWEQKRDELSRQLFSPPGGATAEWRRLRDEATAIKDPEEVRRRLELALQHGDELEARAYGSAALDRAMAGGPTADPWVAVANVWGESDSQIDDALTAMSAHQAANPRGSVRDRMFSGVPLPEELGANNSWPDLVGLAGSADGSDLTPTAHKAAQDQATTFKGWSPLREVG